MTTNFNQEFLEEIAKILKDEETRLTRELKNIANKNEKGDEDYDARFPQFGDKEDENAAEVAVYGDNLTLERELEKALRDIKKALGQIEDGSYGICKYCKKPIDERRLRARPASSACVDCKKLLTQEA